VTSFITDVFRALYSIQYTDCPSAHGAWHGGISDGGRRSSGRLLGVTLCRLNQSADRKVTCKLLAGGVSGGGLTSCPARGVYCVGRSVGRSVGGWPSISLSALNQWINESQAIQSDLLHVSHHSLYFHSAFAMTCLLGLSVCLHFVNYNGAGTFQINWLCVCRSVVYNNWLQ